MENIIVAIVTGACSIVGVIYGTARSALDSHREQISFSGKALPGGQFQYRRDYSLGDKVTVQNEFGISGTAVVSEATEVMDENGYQVIPTLSEQVS